VDESARQLALFSDNEEPGNQSGFSVRQNKRARRLSIKVFPRGRVEVVVPPRTRPETVQAFVSEHTDWINNARASFAEIHPPEPFLLPAIVELAAIEQQFRIRYERRSKATTVPTGVLPILWC
jgi:predicted metal-dependent hydrolase